MDLGLVEDVKEDHVVSAVPQAVERVMIGPGSPSRSEKIITRLAWRSMAATWVRLWAMSVVSLGL